MTEPEHGRDIGHALLGRSRLRRADLLARRLDKPMGLPRLRMDGRGLAGCFLFMSVRPLFVVRRCFVR